MNAPWPMRNSRCMAVRAGNCVSVWRMSGRYGSIAEARRTGPINGKPAWDSTRATVSRCNCSWVAIVPTRQRSAW